MIDKAKEKIKEEIAKSNNVSIKVIGEYLLKQIEVNKSAAEKIVDGQKTIEGSLQAMAKEAKKVAVKGSAVLTDEEGFKIVSKYYGFEGVQQELVVPGNVENARKEEVTDDKPKKRFSMDIGDLGL